MHDSLGGVLGLIGLALSGLFGMVSLSDSIYTLGMAVLTASAGYLTKKVWDKIFRKKRTKTN